MFSGCVRLSKKLLFGEVKGLRPPGRPRSSFIDVTLHDCQNCHAIVPYRDAQTCCSGETTLLLHILSSS